jgi:threonine dehydrogenase-like Zn-dependent dehydrogenase
MEPAAERAQFAAESHAVSIAAEDYGNLVVDVVLECSGSAAATSTALKLLAPGGILVVVGAGPDPGLDSATILLKEIIVRGSYIYTPRLYQDSRQGDRLILATPCSFGNASR